MSNRIIVELDTSKSNYNIFECKQNDDLILEVNIFENGIEKDITNATITINCTRANETYVIQNTGITKSKNKIIANLKRDFTRVDGLDKFEIVLLENEKQNTTFDFNILVKPSVLKLAVEESKDTVIILEELGNKIVQAGAAKAETELLIKNGNAATKGDIATVNSHLEQNNNEIKNKADIIYVDNKVAKISSGTPLFASSVANMTDTSKNYVHMTDGYIYTYNGTEFIKSSIKYQATGIDDNSITEEKLSFSANLSITDNIERVEILKNTDKSINISIYGLNGGNIVIYPLKNGSVYTSGSLDTKKAVLTFNIPNWGILIYDFIQKAFRILGWSDARPSRYILLADNSEGLCKTGYLIDVKNSLDTVELSKITEKIKSNVVLENVNSMYIWNTNVYNDYIYFKFIGNLNIEDRNISFEELCNEIGRTDLRTSGDKTKNCLYLKDGEFLVYDSYNKLFKIRPWNIKIELYDNLLLKNIGGKAVDGQFLEFQRSYIEYNRRDNSSVIFDNLTDNILKKTNKVQQLDASNIDNVKLVLITDLHQNEFEKRTYSMGVNIINEYYKSWGLDCVLNAGDNITYSANKGSKDMAIMEHAYLVNKFKPLTLYSVGNHDCNGWDSSSPQLASTMINNKELYLNYGKHLKDKVVWGSKIDMYYYYDIPTSDVRIIVLNSNDTPWIVNEDGTVKYNGNLVYGFRQNQLNWLANVALKTNKHCLIVCHIPPVGHYEGMYYNYTLPYNYLQLRYILEDFKNGNTRVINKANDKEEFNLSNLNTNFTSQGAGNIIGVFSGHLHLDHIKEINGIKYVCTNCDLTASWTPENPDAETGEIWTIPDREMQTVSQYCFDVITINTNTRKINLTRFGVGEDREFTY